MSPGSTHTWGRGRSGPGPEPGWVYVADRDLNEKLDRDLAILRCLDGAAGVCSSAHLGSADRRRAVAVAVAVTRGAAAPGSTSPPPPTSPRRCQKAALETVEHRHGFFAGPRLLVIDELGYLPLPGDGT